jgi:hypothetical protein
MIGASCVIQFLDDTGSGIGMLGEWNIEGALYTRRIVLIFVLISALVFGSMRWRDYASLGQLRELVQIPEVVDVTAVPSRQQMQAIVSAMQKSPVKPWLATSEDIQELATRIRDNKNPTQMWILVTSLKPAAVGDFYQSEEHRPGWEVAAKAPGCCMLLRRGSSELLVAFGPDRAGKGTQVVYSLSLDAQKTAP